VRELAAATLAGLVRATEDDSFLHHVRRVSLDKATTLQASAKRARQHKRQQARAVAAGNGNGGGVDGGGATDGNAGSSVAEPTLAQRHGPILGLVALVQSSPYSVPAWLPEVVSRLAGAASEPPPIRDTVTKALAEFKKTHHDTWAATREAFSEQQWEMLTDLAVSPSYFV